MTSEQKVRLMIVPRNDAGVPTTTSFSGTVEARRELYRELEAEGLVEIEDQQISQVPIGRTFTP